MEETQERAKRKEREVWCVGERGRDVWDINGREEGKGTEHMHGPPFKTQLRMRYLMENQLLLVLASCALP